MEAIVAESILKQFKFYLQYVCNDDWMLRQILKILSNDVMLDDKLTFRTSYFLPIYIIPYLFLDIFLIGKIKLKHYNMYETQLSFSILSKTRL